MAKTINRLGDYIKEVNLRNARGIDNLYGLSMTKEFRKSTSNIVGVDLSKYKIVKENQFACDFMSPIRVNRLPVVINKTGQDIIVSPAYPVFEVIDEDILDPDYLMLWFRRSEFDRHVVFQCDGGVRGGYGWTELCNEPIYVPNIDRQHRIVQKYYSLQAEIDYLEKLNDLSMNLGDKLLMNDVKSSVNVDKRRLGEFFPIVTGKKDVNYGDNGGKYPFYTCAKEPIKSPGYSFDSDSILLAGNGNFDLNWHKGKFEAYQRVYVLTPYNKNYLGLLFFTIRHYKDDMTGGAQGSVIQFITKGMIEDYCLGLPNNEELDKIADKYDSIIDYISGNRRTINTLQSMKEIIIKSIFAWSKQ